MGRRVWRPSAAAMGQHRRDFPPAPPRFATIDLVIEEAVAFVGALPRSKREKLRGLFPGKTDAQIIDELVDALLDRFGVT